MDRFDKFTDRARKVLTLAQDEAQRFNHNYIGTEHLLLGLVREGEGVAARVLENMNVELAKVRTAVEFIIGRGDRPVVGEVGLTPRAKRVIELAIDEARRLGHNYIGTEHLLLGLVRVSDGVGGRVLASVGVDADRARQEVLAVLAGSSAEPRSAEPTSGEPTWAPSPSSTAPMVVTGQLSPDAARRARAAALAAVTVHDSPLQRVVGLGVTATDADVTVELIALEIRSLGAILHWKARPAGKPAGTMLGEPALALTDDVGTVYEISSGGWSGSDRLSRGEILVSPGPPTDALRM
ncbi:MAG TPA: Clp protease N-terminal domain-containing protein, partial [Candidatus Limnocylindrales bacterium]